MIFSTKQRIRRVELHKTKLRSNLLWFDYFNSCIHPTYCSQVCLTRKPDPGKSGFSWKVRGGIQLEGTMLLLVNHIRWRLRETSVIFCLPFVTMGHEVHLEVKDENLKAVVGEMIKQTQWILQLCHGF